MTTVRQLSFAAGEIAPALYGRVDQVKYTTGLRTLRNFFVMRHGGATNRPGSYLVGPVKDSTKTIRLMPFVFNTSQTYVLEFGNLYLRIIKNGAPVKLTGQAITAVTNASPAVVTYAGADNYANGDEVLITGVVGTLGLFLNGRRFKVAGINTGANTFQLNYLDGTVVSTVGKGTWTSGGLIEEIYTLTTPYLEADLPYLQFVQSADVITIVHPDYAPRQLARSGDAVWTLTAMTFAPETVTPTSPTATPQGTTGSTTYRYKVTAINSETFEESLPTSAITTTTGHATLDVTNHVLIAWTTVSGSAEYNVYKERNGIYGLIGIAGEDGSPTFMDIGIAADTTDTPPTSRNPFNSADDYPSAVTYYQQRLVLANTDNNPETVYASRSGNFTNFTTSSPTQDDDAVTFTMAGRQVNEVVHMLDLGTLVLFTASGEWGAQGDQAGILTPSQVNTKQHSYHGASHLSPIVIGGTAIFVQARGSILRDLAFDYQSDGYRGNDLTIFSAHLVDGYGITDWAYQQTPHSIVWMVRDDGVLLAMTYIREHQVIGWSRHDTDGFIENVCVIPEGSEDSVYITVRREIDGETVRYIERLTQRRVDEIEDAIFMDATLSYDGRNDDDSHTMTLSGSGWTSDDSLTLTSSTSYFESGDVGDEIHITGADGTIIRAEITAYTSVTVVTVKPDKDVPVAMQATALSDWAHAVDTVSGLWHLEGENVSVFADGNVVGSPNNEEYTVVTVADGQAVLDRPYGVIHVGLPYISDMETLNVDAPQGEGLVGKFKKAGKVILTVEKSRGIFAGPKPPSDDADDPLEGLDEARSRNEESYDDSAALVTDEVEIIMGSEWNSNGRIFIRQVDPVPLSVLSVSTDGHFPFTG